MAGGSMGTPAPVQVLDVQILAIAQRLQGLILMEHRHGKGGVHIVGQVGIVCRRVMVNWKTDIHPIA